MSWTLSLDELIKATNGSVISRKDTSFSGVGTDTRQDLTGKIFVALKGDVHDAHAFVQQAVEKGAAALLVHQDSPEISNLGDKVSIVKVADTLKAIQKLAQYWRRRNHFNVVGISGSNGKTTTKEFAQAIISPSLKVHASKGSFNNHWGVPISILGAPEETQLIIQEMGMNHAGELTELCQIAEPRYVIVTMVGQSHIGELGSQEAVARAKEEMYVSSPQAVAIFNGDNQYTLEMLQRFRKSSPNTKIFTFSQFNRMADVHLRAETMSMDEMTVSGVIGGVEGKTKVRVIGRQNVINLSAACSIALAVGLRPEQIWPHLSECKTTWGRNQIVTLSSGTKILFDAYNANPESMASLIRNVLEWNIEGKKVGVFGEMLELGVDSPRLHKELGEMVGSTDFDLIWFMGAHKADFEAGLKASGFSKTHFISDTYEQTLAIKLASMLNPQDIVVVKGSRGMKLEQVLEAWGARLTPY